MSVENFDGNGLADQPSVVYGYTDDTDELHIRELCRSGYGEPGPSPGDVIERDSTQSTLEDGLPALPLPGQDGLQQEDCGEDIPAFGCEECGSPLYVGRTCASPLCSRDWAAAVKSKTVSTAGKLWAMQHVLNERHHEDIDHNHVVASMPDFLVESDEPIERALLVLETLLREHWGIDDIVAVYHPYRIKQEYRADQYEHGGESGEGSMTWKDVLCKPNPDEYIYHSPHFHVFFAAKRRQFDYSVAEAVQAQSGWSLHRITKGGQASDDNTSVEDLDDLVHQLTYCLSHAGVQQVADRHELCSRLKGDIHNLWVPDDITDKIVATFCAAAPKLLGVQFANLSDATCDEEIEPQSDDGSADEPASLDGDTTDMGTDTSAKSPDSAPEDDSTAAGADADHPLLDVLNPDADVDGHVPSNGNPWPSTQFEAGTPSSSGSSSDDWTTGGGGEDSANGAVSGDSDDTAPTDGATTCGGGYVPIWELSPLLEDDEWCESAAHADGARDALREWQRRTGGDEALPWADPDEDAVDVSEVVRQPD